MTSATRIEEPKKVDESAVKSLGDQIGDLRSEIKVLEAERFRVSKHCGIITGLGEQVRTLGITPKNSEVTIVMLVLQQSVLL